MKKLLCIALFSFAIMANATEKNEIVTNTAYEKVVVKDYTNKIMVNNFKEIKTANNKCNKEISEDEMIASDCGEKGNLYYAKLRDKGYSHRDARAERRDNVRECRGGTWAWLNVFVFYYD